MGRVLLDGGVHADWNESARPSAVLMLPQRHEEESGAQVESASERFGSMWACGTLRRPFTALWSGKHVG